MKLRTVVAILAVTIAASGCLSLKSYVDPALPKVSYGDLLARPAPTPVALGVTFKRNGEPYARATSTARDSMRAVIERSKLFSAVLDTPATDVDRLDVVLDNVGDRGDAAGKGAVTGLTFGAKGSQVTDGYVFTATFLGVGKAPVTKVYRHAIHTTIGSAEAPAGLQPESSPRAAFDKVVEGLMLNLLLDLQKEERL